MQHTNSSPTWVVVADNCKARIFRLVKFPKIEEISNLEHPESRLRNQDLVSSKPGRTFESTGTSRSAYQSETEPKQVESIKFAAELGKLLNQAEQNNEFSRLYLISEPSFLGLLRQQISQETQKKIIAEVAKELTTCDIETIENHLSEL